MTYDALASCEGDAFVVVTHASNIVTILPKGSGVIRCGYSLGLLVRLRVACTVLMASCAGVRWRARGHVLARCGVGFSPNPCPGVR